SLGISGQINKQMSYVDDGTNTAFAVMDNTNSGSRFRFTGEEDIGNGLKVGGVWEWQWQNTPSSGATFNSAGEISETTATDVGLQDRKTELYFASKWGKVSLGKGDGAGNGAAEVDLSGTAVIDYCGANGDQMGSFSFQTGVGQRGPGAGPSVGSVLGCFDMFSRNDRIRYDTPKLAKWLTVSASRAQANTEEIAVRASGTAGGVKIAAALATGSRDGEVAGDRPRAVTAISASVLLKMGLNFTLSHSMTETDVDVGSDPSQSFTYFKVGWRKGKHNVGLGFGQTDFDNSGSAAVDSSNPTSLALSYVYNLAKDVEIYAAYRDLDADFTGVDGLSSLTVGSRIKWK
ncbi:MAG: porin, partial [Acidiferrobacterales bacterium]|nr:porin [Acidiferrobacterales bacterium]